MIPPVLQAQTTSRAVPCLPDSSNPNRGVTAPVDAPGPVILRLIDVKGHHGDGKVPGKLISLSINPEYNFRDLEGTGQFTVRFGLSLIF